MTPELGGGVSDLGSSPTATPDGGTLSSAPNDQIGHGHVVPSARSAAGTAFCSSEMIIEGDILETDWATAAAQRARISVSRVLKGNAPAEVSYAHPVSAGGLGRLVVGDHVVVFGEYDPSRGYILNRDEQRPHLVRDDSVTPSIMYLRDGMPPQMARNWEPTVVASIFPEYRLIRYARSTEIRRDGKGAVIADGGSGDPRTQGAPWDELIEQIRSGIEQRGDCAMPGQYGGIKLEPVE
jgi:hypothetical protein